MAVEMEVLADLAARMEAKSIMARAVVLAPVDGESIYEVFRHNIRKKRTDANDFRAKRLQELL